MGEIEATEDIDRVLEDVVRANITAAGSKETSVFNIGSGEAVTIEK